MIWKSHTILKTIQPATIPFRPIIIKPILIRSVTVIMILTLALMVMPLPETKSFKLSSYNLVLLNHLSNLSLDLAKQKAAIIKKGNDGRSGKAAPMAPNTKPTQPNTIIFSSFFLLLHQMSYRNNRMMKQHPRARETHNFLYLFPHVTFITMYSTL